MVAVWSVPTVVGARAHPILVDHGHRAHRARPGRPARSASAHRISPLAAVPAVDGRVSDADSAVRPDDRLLLSGGQLHGCDPALHLHLQPKQGPTTDRCHRANPGTVLVLHRGGRSNRRRSAAPALLNTDVVCPSELAHREQGAPALIPPAGRAALPLPRIPRGPTSDALQLHQRLGCQLRADLSLPGAELALRWSDLAVGNAWNRGRVGVPGRGLPRPRSLAQPWRWAALCRRPVGSGGARQVADVVRLGRARARRALGGDPARGAHRRPGAARTQ